MPLRRSTTLWRAVVLAVVAPLLTIGSPAGGAVTPSAADPFLPLLGDQRPNVVLFLVDDMRSDELAYMPQTRALLARQGTTFANNISPHPLCCPARAELLSGQYAQNNGVQHNSGPLGGYDAFDPDDTVTRWINQDDYQTAYIGKYLNGYVQGDPRSAGWDLWSPLIGPTADYFSYRFYRTPPVEKGYITTAVSSRTDVALRYFASRDPAFFMFVNHTAPHARVAKAGARRSYMDLPPPADPAARGEARRFEGLRSPSLAKPSFNVPRDGGPRLDPREVQELFEGRVSSLQAVDDAVGDLVDTLTETDELDDTYIVFASDNGLALGEHAVKTKNLLMREVLDVPLIIRGPGITRGAVSTEITSLVDLPATFLDLTGVRAQRPLDGRSLVPLLRGERGQWRDTTLIQTGSAQVRGVRFPGWASRGVQTSRYLYGTTVNRPGGEFLYDRRRDPFELRNVARDPAYRRVVAELRRRTHALADCAGASCNQRFGRTPAPRRSAR